MFTNFPFFPEQASAQAAQVDGVFFFMVAVTAFFSLLIATLVVVFAIKYRRRHKDEIGAAIHGSLALELLWTIIPFGITMVMFGGRLSRSASRWGFSWGAQRSSSTSIVRQPVRWRCTSSASNGCGRRST